MSREKNAAARVLIKSIQREARIFDVKIKKNGCPEDKVIGVKHKSEREERATTAGAELRVRLGIPWAAAGAGRISREGRLCCCIPRLLRL
jgi:hypothetical protein